MIVSCHVISGSEMAYKSFDGNQNPPKDGPSWPGKLIRFDGSSKVMVCWFGNKDTTQVDTQKLKSLSDGLEVHHRERKKLR